MSLLKDYTVPCVLLEEYGVPDGEGGAVTAWTEGRPFEVCRWLDTSLEARQAEKEGVKNRYSAFAAKSFPLKYGGVFRDRRTGLTYRVTSDPDAKQAPASSTFDLKYFTAERWDLPV